MKGTEYNLPDPLVLSDGTKVFSAEMWYSQRRPEILELFKKYVYGRVPNKPIDTIFEMVSIENQALEGKATRKEVSAIVKCPNGEITINILIYLPNNQTNFYGNHTIHADLGITLSKQWIPRRKGFSVKRRAIEGSRGRASDRWNVELLIERGYGIATFYCGDIDPDFNDDFKNGVHPLFYRKGQEIPDPDEWGAISAWAWGLSRVMDYFEIDDDIDHEHIAVFGHSRLGKTALWAGARDQRFSIVISNNSGCGGAALSRRRSGETIKIINDSFPHWFCANFKEFNDKEDELLVDQHMLVALMAPRSVYIASAEEDLWSDPLGEFLSAKHADPVYKLLGTDGLATDKLPELNTPITSTIGYHIRSGGHNISIYDWERYMDFADHHFKKQI